MTYVSYPRLATHDAVSLMFELLDAAPEERERIGKSWRGKANTSPVATRFATETHLDVVRARVVSHARAHGFGVAEEPTKGFDVGLPAVLLEALEISAAEAGRADVWNYLTLVLLPDVAVWRWPNPRRDPGYERLLGKPRNCFRRHWRRGTVVGPRLAGWLSEDELVQLTERPDSLGGDPRVARTAADLFRLVLQRWDLQDQQGRRVRWSREFLMRQYGKDVTLYGRTVALGALPEDEIRRQLAAVIERSATTCAAQQDLVLRQWRPLVDESLATSTVPVDVRSHEVSVAREFSAVVFRLFERAEDTPEVDARFLRTLIADFGAVEAVARLALEGNWDRRVTSVDTTLAVRPLVLDERFSELFTEEVREGARASLAEEREIDDPLAELAVHVDQRLVELEAIDELAGHSEVFRRTMMLHGVVVACNRLIEGPFLSSTFLVLQRMGRAELSLEVLLLEDKYAGLWDETLREGLRARVMAYLA